MMRRREFIAGLASAGALPLAARAQQSALPAVGYLNSESPDPFSSFMAAFRRGLAEHGYVAGQNVVIEYRWGEGSNERLPALAADLVRRQVAVIATGGTPAALAAKVATRTIPIVFFNASDPVRMGLVASFARPGGNVTGITNIGSGLISKRLDMLHQLVPAGKLIAMLVDPTNMPITEAVVTEGRTAAGVLGVDLLIVNGSSRDELAAAFSSAVAQGAGALLVGPYLFYYSQIEYLVALAACHAIPASWEDRVFTAVGGLMSYGPDQLASYRQLGGLAASVLDGKKPADLPVQQSVKFDMSLNLKTAKELGITVPPSLLVAADEVIE
jgi:putative tryptophan/tyrosine transport system substrate-binding protein